MEDDINKNRNFLKDYIRLETDFAKTDQNRGINPPPIEKPFSKNARRITLSGPEDWHNIIDPGLLTAIKERKSHRRFMDTSIDIEELSFLLWATQGLRKISRTGVALRNVPSAGNRHAFETYIAVLNVESLEKGIYRYLPLEHELIYEFSQSGLSEKISAATLGQTFAGTASAVFIWTAIPYRMEWRYGNASYKVIAIDIGHVCQNLYLASKAVNCGTCAIAAYDQDLMNELVKADGKEEFVIYLAPVGKV
ncbi:MAG: SagB/ThcOx family dehydrogenase [Candidatus Humimicrobiaceae bacterium]